MGKSVNIEGFVFRKDDRDMDADFFLDEFLEFVESKGYLFMGMTKPVDEKDENEGE